MSKSEGRAGPKTRWQRRAIARVFASPAEARTAANEAITRAADDLEGHRYFHDDAWQFPHANRGGREAIFTCLVGPISAKSVLIHVCGDPNCVAPAHVEVENREVYAAKRAGTFDPYIISPDGRPIRKSEFERTLRLHPCRITGLDRS